MSYLLDADWIINALAGRKDAIDTIRQLSPHGIAISLVTIGEIYEVAFNSSNPEAYISSLRDFILPFRKIDLNDPIMEKFAEVRSNLRRTGKLIPDFDILIGVTALNYNLTLLTKNRRHLDRIPDLKIYT